MINEVQYKTCSLCAVPKPVEMFPLDYRGKHPRRRNPCKACADARSKAWRAVNKDLVNERARTRNKSETYKAKARIRQKRWRRNHPEEARRQHIELRAKHRSK